MGSLGQVLVWAGIFLSALTAVQPRFARITAAGAAGALVGTCVALAVALWRIDLSLGYVADHARREVAPHYRVAGLWGGASGSLLMFAAMLAVVVAAVPVVRRAPMATRIGAATVTVLAGVVALTKSPFERLDIPAIRGSGLQPVLEHPAMLYHPPILYAGLVATFVPFAIALMSRHEGWQSDSRRATALALAIVTVGQLTGANWAYVELGWGGYWGWDPVENTVLVVWLLLIAALHAVGRSGHRSLVLLASAPWCAVLVGAAVTRTGVGGSIHAFADDGRIGPVVTATAIVTTAGTVMAARRSPAGGAWQRSLPTIGVVLTIVAALVVLEGVLFPIPAPGEPLVSGRFYATVTAPLALVATALAGRAFCRVPWAWSAGGAAAGLVVGLVAGARTPFALGACGAAAVVGVGLVAGARSRTATWSMRLAHTGFAVLMLGVAGSTQAERTTVTLLPRDEFELAGVVLAHRDAGVGMVGKDDAVVATLDVLAGRSGNGVVTLRPALVERTDRATLLSETALDSRLTRDVQVVLRAASDDGSARYDIAVTPLVQLVWWGAAMVAAGAAFAAGGQRLRLWRLARARSSSADIVSVPAAAAAASSD